MRQHHTDPDFALSGYREDSSEPKLFSLERASPSILPRKITLRASRNRARSSCRWLSPRTIWAPNVVSLLHARTRVQGSSYHHIRYFIPVKGPHFSSRIDDAFRRQIHYPERSKAARRSGRRRWRRWHPFAQRRRRWRRRRWNAFTQRGWRWRRRRRRLRRTFRRKRR